MPSNRLFQLVCLLLEKGQMTAPDLARHLEVSVRTIYRDLETLSAAGVPVRAVPGKGGGRVPDGATTCSAVPPLLRPSARPPLRPPVPPPPDPLWGPGCPDKLSCPAPGAGPGGLAPGGPLPAGAPPRRTPPGSMLCGRPSSPAERWPLPMSAPTAPPPGRKVLPARLVFKGPGLVSPGILSGPAGLPHLPPQPYSGAGDPGALRPVPRPASGGGDVDGRGVLSPGPAPLLPTCRPPGVRRVRRPVRDPGGGRGAGGIGVLSRGPVALRVPAIFRPGGGGAGAGEPAAAAGPAGEKSGGAPRKP